MVIEAVYPRIERKDSDRCRAAKRKASSEAQKRMNAIHSRVKLECSLAANYRAGDLWVTVTYDDEHLPKSRAEARLRFKYFLAKLSAARKKKNQKTIVHWNAEHKHEHEDHWQNKRWHHHFFVNATGADFETIRSCWIYGSNIEIVPIKLDKDNTFEALARYMCKEPADKLGQHVWYCTRNAKKPEIDTQRIESDEQIHIPRGSLLLLNEGGENQYTKWRVVKYLLPGWDSPDAQAPAAKHRRQKRKR